MRSGTFAVLLAIGAAVRLAALALPGTIDVQVWKIWSHAASTSTTQVYGVGGNPPQRAILEYGGERTTVDYPPMALYALGAAGRLYRIYDPAYRDSPVLTAAVKLPGMIATIALTAVLFAASRRFSG